jgi:hypothetical protein
MISSKIDSAFLTQTNTSSLCRASKLALPQFWSERTRIFCCRRQNGAQIQNQGQAKCGERAATFTIDQAMDKRKQNLGD